MNKERYKEISNATIDTNYETLSSLLERGLVIFEVDSVRKEIVNCLMLNLFQASITLTNHLLERGLKLALIHNKTGIELLPIGDNERKHWEIKHKEAHEEFGGKKLNTTIATVYSEKLISEEERNILNEIIRDDFRNGFSHADMNKILRHVKQSTTLLMGSFDNPTSLKEIELDQKGMVFLQPFLQDNIAEENALPYFKYVYKLLINIEKKLQDKFKAS